MVSNAERYCLMLASNNSKNNPNLYILDQKGLLEQWYTDFAKQTAGCLSAIPFCWPGYYKF